MPPKFEWNKTILALVKIGISVAILTWLFLQAKQENQFAEIASREKNWVWLVVAFQLCLLAHFVSFVRWRILVQALNVPFTTIDATRIGLIGCFFGLFAFGVVGGDTLRVYYAARHARQKLAEVICSVFTDRAIGMLTMFSFATIGFMFVDIDFDSAENPRKLAAIRYLCTLVSAATITGWVVVLMFLLAPKAIAAGLQKRLSQFPRLAGIVQQLADVVSLYRERKGTLLACVGWSVVVNLCFVGTIYLIAVGLNVVHPPLSKHFLIAPISTSANAIPLPGGLGGMEFVLAYFYDAMSTEQTKTEHGIVVAFAFRFLFLILAACGAIAWFVNRKQIHNVVHQPEFPGQT